MGMFDWLGGRFQGRNKDTSSLGLSTAAQEKLCRALRVESVASAQDLLNSLLLSECVYKAHDLGPHEAVKNLKAVQKIFPPGITSLQAVQCSLPHVHHRYLVAFSPETMYVSFIGTKLAKDLLVDVNLLHRRLWQATESDSDHPAAHRGFLARAKRVPIEELLAHAQKKNKKLLLCGHSLGGAVAILCALRVLQHAADVGLSQPPISCITFGTPAIGNSALASKVQQQGWNDCFRNVILPGYGNHYTICVCGVEDLVPRLLALNPDASGPALAAALEAPSLPQRPAVGPRRWPNPGFASRLTPFRRPQITVQSGGASAVTPPAASLSERALSVVRPVRLESQDGEPMASQDAFAARARTRGEEHAESARAWALPRRLWRQSKGSTQVQDANILPPRAPASTQAPTENAESLPPEHTNNSALRTRGGASGIVGAVQAVGRRIPGQAWLSGAQPSTSNSGSAQLAAVEEDGAVDALVDGPEVGISAGENPENSATSRSSWLARLSQLQNLAASAASSVGNVGQLLPTYVHFGQTIIWAPPEDAPELPMAFPTNDLRSRVLANHRMPAYRLRALAHCAATTGLADSPAHSSSVYLSDEVVPKPCLHSATADLPPMSPSEHQNAPQSRWSWIPYVGSEGSSQASDLTLKLTVKGEAMDAIRQGRVLAFGSTWCPARILDEADHSKKQPKSVPAAGGLLQSLPGSAWLKGPMQPVKEEAEMLVEAHIPGPVAAQMYHGHLTSPDPALELHVRSDFVELAVPATVRVPTVWVLGSSATATRKLMAALNAQSPLARRAVPPLSVQPAELVLDGAKWCNLLAAPVTPPSVAMSALGLALPSLVSNPGATGPLRIAAGIVQGLQAWLVGPPMSLREGTSCSAIVLAVDDSAPLPQRQLTNLLLQAERAGVSCILAPLGSTSQPETAEKTSARHSALVKLQSSDLSPNDVLELRQAAFRALSGQPVITQHPAPLAKL